jgi:hypothetical protein
MAAFYMCGGAQRAISPLPCGHAHRGTSASRSGENGAARLADLKRWLRGLHTEIEGVQRAVPRTQGPTDLRDAFDCARGKLIAGIIAP